MLTWFNEITQQVSPENYSIYISIMYEAFQKTVSPTQLAKISTDIITKVLSLDHGQGITGRLHSLLSCSETPFFKNHLRQIDLESNRLGPLCARHLPTLDKVLEKYPQLQQINLHYSGLGLLKTADFQAFCNMLAHCPQLQQINLSNNALTHLNETSCQALGAALILCKNLKKINLSDNFLYDNNPTFRQLCASLSECKNLTQIIVTGPLLFEMRTTLKNICRDHHNDIVKRVATAAGALINRNVPPEVREPMLLHAFPFLTRKEIQPIQRTSEKITLLRL